MSHSSTDMSRPRSYDRTDLQMRPMKLTRGVMPHSKGSCLVECGETRVLCAATIEEGVPSWRRGAHAGWLTAEYAMLPCSTTSRSRRELGSRKGRSMEIERLIGRSLRTVCNLSILGEHTITVDCDVLNADGGTRTASVTGAWVAVHDACKACIRSKMFARMPLIDQVVALSVGVVKGQVLVDLDYAEDSSADVDMNLVYTGSHAFVEVQGTGEQTSFDRARLNELLDAGEAQLQELLRIQDACVGWSR